MKKVISILVLACFFSTSILGQNPIYAQEFHLSPPGTMVALSPEFNPPILKGIKIHPENPFRFDFILDKGDGSNRHPERAQRASEDSLKEQLKKESAKLIKYFLASLTIPEKDLWVNLSPYEKDRIIPSSFGQTEMGRDLLAEDYMLKQITASLIYPEDEVGKRFWKRIYEEAQKKFGTTNIPVNTFNKVWIVPEKAVVYENTKAGTAYVVESKLKVMLEKDYLSLSNHECRGGPCVRPLSRRIQGLPLRNDINSLGSQIVREIVIPELTKEINEDKNFAQLRQVYNSLILATWYKNKIRDSILEQVYADKNKINGLSFSKDCIGNPQHIYQQYLQAFKKGVYNYIKEDLDPFTRQSMPKKYFSGGAVFGHLSQALIVTTNNGVLPDQAMNSLIEIRSLIVAGLMGGKRAVEFKEVDKVKYSLLNPIPRPEPEKMLSFIKNGLTEDDIHRIAIQAGFKPLALRKTLKEVDNLMPYIRDIVTKLYENYGRYPIYTMLFSGRDAENLYDAYVAMAQVKGWQVKAKLIPGSRQFWLKANQIPAFLKHEALTPEAFNRGEKFIIVDSGFRGTIGKMLVDKIDKIYPHSHVSSHVFIKIIGANDDSKQFQLIHWRPLGMMRRFLFPRVNSLDVGDFDAAWWVASSLQMMPRFHGAYSDFHSMDNSFIYSQREGFSGQKSIENPSNNNADIVNPYAALLVQFRLIKRLYQSSQVNEAMTAKDPLVLRTSPTIITVAKKGKIDWHAVSREYMEEYKNIFDMAEFWRQGYTNYRTSHGEFLFILRRIHEDQFRDLFLLNVFDKKHPEKLSIAQLHFSLSGIEGTRVALLNFSAHYEFNLLDGVLEENGFHSSNWVSYWRSLPNQGFWINEEYRNIKKKDIPNKMKHQGVWNLDRLLMAVALNIARKSHVCYFLINSTINDKDYYGIKYNAKPNERFLSGIYDKIIDLNEESPNSNYVKRFVDKKVEIFLVRNDPDPAMESRNTGGIDLRPEHMNLQTRVMDSRGDNRVGTGNGGEGIKFHINPAMLAGLKNAPGFVPVIINIQPVSDLKAFLDSVSVDK